MAKPNNQYTIRLNAEEWEAVATAKQWWQESLRQAGLPEDMVADAENSFRRAIIREGARVLAERKLKAAMVDPLLPREVLAAMPKPE